MQLNSNKQKIKKLQKLQILLSRRKQNYSALSYDHQLNPNIKRLLEIQLKSKAQKDKHKNQISYHKQQFLPKLNITGFHHQLKKTKKNLKNRIIFTINPQQQIKDQLLRKIESITPQKQKLINKSLDNSIYKKKSNKHQAKEINQGITKNYQFQHYLKETITQKDKGLFLRTSLMIDGISSRKISSKLSKIILAQQPIKNQNTQSEAFNITLRGMKKQIAQIKLDTIPTIQKQVIEKKSIYPKIINLTPNTYISPNKHLIQNLIKQQFTPWHIDQQD